MRYIALGDSISIDRYPALDAFGVTTPASRGLGASSLFYRNDDSRWPEFHGRDLATLHPELQFRNEHAFSSPSHYPTDNYTTDGATSHDVLQAQLPRVEASDERSLVTITAGGNDMLMNLRAPRVAAGFVEGIVERLTAIVDETLRKLPNAQLLLGTVYDPSDGTNVLYGERLDREAEWLAAVNAGIRQLATTRAQVTLIDIHQHFLGHGLSAPETDRWYWSGLIFEPNARGASEVRRLWVSAIG